MSLPDKFLILFDTDGEVTRYASATECVADMGQRLDGSFLEVVLAHERVSEKGFIAADVTDLVCKEWIEKNAGSYFENDLSAPDFLPEHHFTAMEEELIRLAGEYEDEQAEISSLRNTHFTRSNLLARVR